MTSIFARNALLPGGWQRNVRVQVVAGRIAGVVTDAAAEAEDIHAGVVVAGLCNAHSHAFQRALAGHTEYRAGAGRDNFWSWRERMYALSALIDAPRLEAIARQAYCEMVASGYTTVAEFHYLHSEPGRLPSESMFDALCRAAKDSGIRLTYVPVLYERGGFDNEPLSAEQQRFHHDLPAFLEHYRQCRERAGKNVTVAIGAHSLRAVSHESLRQIAALAEADAAPLHLHIAEQQREVQQSLAARHRRPVRWLLENFALNERWCLVHATHVDADEVAALAQTGAVACLCPSTEANLGDGLFPLAAYLQQGGRIAIGSDSHITINPFEELRWLEYGQRLTSEQRNVAAIGIASSGHNLFDQAAAGGALASGQRSGRIEVAAHADLLLFDDDDPMLAGHDADSFLDALVFSGYSLPLDRVMINGAWQVIDGRHVRRDAAADDYRQTVAALSDDLRGLRR